MERLTARVPERYAEWVRSEASDRRSEAAVLRDVLAAVIDDDGPYADDGDTDLRERVERVERRVDELNDRLAGVERDHETPERTPKNDTPETPTDSSDKTADVRGETRAEIRRVLADGEYAVSDVRVDAITGVVSLLKREGEVSTAEARRKLDAFDTGLSDTGQWWAETARRLSVVETPGRGGNTYRWVEE
jgi:hypothetical protein